MRRLSQAVRIAAVTRHEHGSVVVADGKRYDVAAHRHTLLASAPKGHGGASAGRGAASAAAMTPR